MNLLSILIISISLAMDAFSVSIGQGIIRRTNRLRLAIRASFSFGLFQMMMPFIGWIIGDNIKGIEDYDHWFAFALLNIVGGKMIFESIKDAPKRKDLPLVGFIELIILSIATSIDALIVGFSLSLLKVPLILPLVMFGLITFLFSFTGILLGNKIGKFLGNKAEIFGGVLLIAIGIKILLDHLGI